MDGQANLALGRVIAEGFVDFDYEITLLTVRHSDGQGGVATDGPEAIKTSFCAPIGHLQIDGDYRESWQPQPMSELALRRAQEIAEKITGNLGGRGLFGVELFVKGDEVIFSEVSPRPHDTGLVTLISQDLSEFALHARAILGLPIPNIRARGPAASSRAVLAAGPRARMLGIGRPRRSPSPIPPSACSASRRSPASAAWAWRWRWTGASKPRARSRAAPPLRSV